MCLIFFALNQHRDYKLMLAANRDEFYNRLTAPAQFWRDNPRIVGGRDLEAMGTWLGMTRTGKISMLTNYRDPKHINPSAPSRGKLVSDYLMDNISPSDYIYNVMLQSKQYNGFNLLAGTVDELYYCSNYKEGFLHLTSGFYGLSNHLLDTPWPKIVQGKAIMEPLFRASSPDTEKIFKALFNDSIAPDDQLPDTGLSPERERALSSMFIKTPNYGSRCSTIILVTRDNQVMFAERTYDLKSYSFTTQSYNFDVETG
jgi:uncharacterized protein with NRDE domain